MIAVCLLTCGREDLTFRTARSFVDKNRGRDDLMLLHADAGGDAQSESCDIAKRFGFDTIYAPASRQPQIISLRTFAAFASIRGAEFIAWLENDWESVAPLPSAQFLRETAEVETIRLFGAMKGPPGPRARAGVRRIGTDELIDWRPFSPGWEIGRAHWAAGGSLIRADVLHRFLSAARLKDVIATANNLVSLRPVENIMNHIGLVSTAGIIG